MANHTRTNDPLFIACALGWHYQIHAAAKEEIMHWPPHRLGAEPSVAFSASSGVRRNVAAIKTAMKHLKDGKLARVREGTRHQTANSAMPRPARPWRSAYQVMIPSSPSGLPAEKKWFRWNPVVFGEAYYPKAPPRRVPTPRTTYAVLDDLMETH